MTKARKIWLWILLVSSGVGVLAGFITMFVSVGSGIYALLMGAGQAAAVWFLLFRERKEGFEGLCVLGVIDIIAAPMMSGWIGFLGTLFGTLIRLGGTVFFLSVGERPMLDIPFFRNLNIGNTHNGAGYTDAGYYEGKTTGTMFCTKCGARLEQGMRFCTSCGTPVENQGMPQQNTAQAFAGTTHPQYRSENGGVMFRADQRAVIVTAACTAIFAILSIIFLAMAAARSGDSLYNYLYGETARMWIILFAFFGIFFLIMAAAAGYAMIIQRKIWLCITESSICGVGIQGIMLTNIECTYAEIQDVYYIQGASFVLVNGRKIGFPGIEDRDRARMMLAQKAARY